MADANYSFEDAKKFAVISRLAEPLLKVLGEKCVGAGVSRSRQRLDKIGPAQFHCQVQPLRIEAGHDRFVLVELVKPQPPPPQQQLEKRFPLRIGGIAVLLFLVDIGSDVGTKQRENLCRLTGTAS